MHAEIINHLICVAVQRLLDEMRREGPHMARAAEVWMTDLAGGEHPAEYFRHPLAFPMLLLPWWMEQTLRGDPDRAFQSDLIYSSINGYYFIRMIDNVMDGHGTVEPALLPMLGFFHTQFHAAYQPYFLWGHPFWSLFQTIGIQSAESTVADAALSDIDANTFAAIAGRKVCGGKIPLAAVALRYNFVDVYTAWLPFYDRLGCWHQMYNDLFGWIKDLRHQTPSYFLCEAKRRKRPDQSVETWVIQEGFAWGVGLLERWLLELRHYAHELDSPSLLDYLARRGDLLRTQAKSVMGAFHHLERLWGWNA